MKFYPQLNKLTYIFICVLSQTLSLSLHKSKLVALAPNGIVDSNSLGQPSNGSLVSKVPYNLTSCAQIMLIEGETVDQNDYGVRAERKFTISAYFVTEQNKTESTQLIKSISLANIAYHPMFLKGAPRCIVFKSNADSIIMCAKTEEDAKSVLFNYDVFMKCRSGVKIGPETKPSEKKVMLNQPCLGLTVDVEKSNITDPIKAQEKFEQAFDKTVQRVKEIELAKKKN